MSQFELTWSGWGGEADHKPTANEPWDQGYVQKGTFWLDNTTNNVWWCSDSGDNSNNNLQWKYAFTFYDDLPAAKTLHSVSSPAFNSPRVPSATKDVHVNALVGISITVLQTSSISAQVDTGSGYVTVANWGIGAVSLSGLTNTLSFFVPAGATYRLIASGNGTTSISSIVEAY